MELPDGIKAQMYLNEELPCQSDQDLQVVWKDEVHMSHRSLKRCLQHLKQDHGNNQDQHLLQADLQGTGAQSQLGLTELAATDK